MLWTVYGLFAVLLVAYLGSLLLRRNGQSSLLVDGWLVAGVELLVSLLCIARGFVREPGRAVALALGLGLLSWSVGDLVLTIESVGGASPPTPSLADAFYLGFYPLAYVAVVIFMRGEVRRLSTPSWLDGGIAGLGAAALCAAFAFRGILHSAGGSRMETVTNLAYPIGDLLLLGLVIGGTALLSGRRKAPWLLLAGGIGLNSVGDTFNLFQHTFGGSHAGSIFNAIAWPTAILAMSMAVWLRQRPSDPLEPQRSTGFVVPELAAAAALAILLIGSLQHTSRVALALAAATLVTVGVRLALSARALRALSHQRHQQSVTDELTGLGNRRYLFQILDAYFADQDKTRMPDRSLAFLFVDLNGFKEINDSFGHPAGDELLRQLGPRLTGAVRRSDFAVRLGGDEFAVVLIDADADATAEIAQRITACIEEPFPLGLVNATIGASIGIASAPADANDPNSLMQCADVAMYRAKLGSFPVAIYAQHLDGQGDRLSLAEQLRAAIDEKQLVLHYQPQLDLRSGEITAVEALLRWDHPRLGLLPPLEFLPLAEEAGLMRPITAFVLDQALTQAADWRAAGTWLAVSVNITATNLLEPGFTGLIQQLLERHQLPANALVLEITETSVIAEFERSRQTIEELRDLGLVVSIDDFGAGFTSLAYLNNLAVGELKLDRTFIANLTTEGKERDRELVRATIDLGHALGLRIVAEGVEDSATLDLLTNLGCDLAQGYHIGKPKPANQLAFRNSPEAHTKPQHEPAARTAIAFTPVH